MIVYIGMESYDQYLLVLSCPLCIVFTMEISFAVIILTQAL